MINNALKHAHRNSDVYVYCEAVRRIRTGLLTALWFVFGIHMFLLECRAKHLLLRYCLPRRLSARPDERILQNNRQ